MSQNRSHLVPTQVVTRNGTLTTVHKKPVSSSTTTAAIPPVTLQKPSSAPKKPSGLELLAEHPSRTAKDLYWMFTHNKKRVGKRVQDAMVAGLHEDTLSILDQPGTRPNAGIVSQLFHSSVQNKSFVPLNNLAVVIDVFNEAEKQHADLFSTYVDGLQMYREHDDELVDWSSKSAAEQEIPKALIRAAIGLKKPHSQANPWVNGNPRHIYPEPLSDLIMERPQDVQRIVDLVNHRDLPVDTEEGMATLKGLLDQEVENPLIGGLL